MKRVLSFCMAVALVASVAVAAELKSGLEPGKGIGAFDVVKCAGPDDSVELGDTLCYRCKYSARPMVMIFTRGTDKKVAALVKELDGAIATSAAEEKDSKKQLAAFVSLLGTDRESLEAQAKEFGASTKAENVPVVVPVEFENGPENYGINPDAAVTVIVAKDSKVTASHAFAEGDLDAKAIAAVLADVAKLTK